MSHSRFAPAAALLLATACTTNPAAAPSPSPAVAAEIPVPAAYRAAVRQGSRSATGAPGERYW